MRLRVSNGASFTLKKGLMQMRKQACYGIVGFVAGLVALAAPQIAHAAGTPLPHVIVLRQGETGAQALRRMRLNEMLALHGITAVTHPASATPDSASPAITSGSIVTTALNVAVPPATPEIKFTYNTPGLLYYAYFAFVSPAGNELYVQYATPVPTSKKGTIAFEDLLSRIGLYAQPGTYTMIAAGITDGSFAQTDYSQSQLQAIFSNLTFSVTNTGAVDFTPPTISAGKILTNTVSLSAAFPFFRSSITAADDVSGVAYPIVFISPPGDGGFGYSFNNYAPLPLLSGKFANATSVAGEPTGTWSIIGYGACDVAENCFIDETQADILSLFGKDSFKVTN
jgi:hypothetical protein